MTKKWKKQTIFAIFLCYVFIYVLLLVPYVVHTNIGDTGVILDYKVIPVKDLPEDIQDVITSKTDCTIHLVEHSTSKKVGVVITTSESTYYPGTVVEVTDKIIDWRVDWHKYSFFNHEFDNLIVGDVEKIGAFESDIETSLSSSIGSVIFSLSKLNFYGGPLLIVVYLSFSFRDRPYLWNAPAIISFYSFEVFFGNVIAAMHDVMISGAERYFGFLFFALVPFTYVFMKYEESEEGQLRIKKYWNEAIDMVDKLIRPR